MKLYYNELYDEIILIAPCHNELRLCYVCDENDIWIPGDMETIKLVGWVKVGEL